MLTAKDIESVLAMIGEGRLYGLESDDLADKLSAVRMALKNLIIEDRRRQIPAGNRRDFPQSVGTIARLTP